MENINGLISSLLKVVAMIELRLSREEVIVDAVSLKCINFKRKTGLDLKINSLVFDEIITKFVLNAILYQGPLFNNKKEEIINIFSAYVAPLIKEIYHPALLQEWRLNIYAAEYKQNIDANLYKPFEKEKLHCVDSVDYWPTSIKETIQWFTFINNVEHTANIMGGEWDNIIIIKGVCRF